MSNLARFKKSGGFNQLISLLESFGPHKKDQFLKLIEEESPRWAQALREKMLTVDRIMSWPDQTVIEVFNALPTKNMAVVMHGLRPEQKSKVMQFINPTDRRRMEESLNGETPTADQIASSFLKFIETTRKLIKEGDLRTEKFDPTVIVPIEYEQMLEGPPTVAEGLLVAHAAAANPGQPVHLGTFNPVSDAIALEAALTTTVIAPHTILAQGPATTAAPPSAALQVLGAKVVKTENLAQEYANLQRAAAQLARDNKALREENRLLKGKLEQIRKIA